MILAERRQHCSWGPKKLQAVPELKYAIERPSAGKITGALGTAVDVLGEEVLEVLLFRAPGFGLAEPGEDEFFELRKTDFALLDLLAESGVVARIAVGDELGELALGEDATRDLERQRVGIEAADVRVEEIVEVDRGAA